MSIAVDTEAVAEFLARSKIQRARENILLESFSPATSAPVWHGSDDIETLDGLDGTYLWCEVLPQMRHILFAFAPGKTGSDGSYRITEGTQVVESGSFHCVPNNPAIGWAAITLLPVKPVIEEPRSFIIEGMLTTGHETGEIDVLVLARIGVSGPVLPLFNATRVKL